MNFERTLSWPISDYSLALRDTWDRYISIVTLLDSDLFAVGVRIGTGSEFLRP